MRLILVEGGTKSFGLTPLQRVRTIAKILVLGEIAALSMFALLEWTAEKAGIRTPDLMACLMFTLSALFYEDVLRRMRNRVTRHMGGGNEGTNSR